ncbi:MAG: hypothetical protein HC850_11860 [Rhodomicrobium sp.]|nr:hypothetical protein [Rhodomicrobium sp.]
MADASLAAALITVSLLILIGVGWRTKSGRRMRLSAIAFASGLLAVAASLLFPQLMAGLNDGPQEMAVKLIASVLLAGAGFLIWPLLRLGTQRRGFISGLTDANLLRQERDDLANAKTTLEKRIVHRSYELERANRQMRLALLGSAITVFRQDKNLRYVWIFNQPPQTLETDFIGKTDDEVFPPDVAMAIAEVKRGAMETGEEQSGEVRVRFPHGVFWYLLRSQPITTKTAR